MTDLLSLGDTAKANAVHTLELVHPDTKEILVLADGSKVTVDYVGFESDDALAANRENRKIGYKRMADGLEPSPEVEDNAFYRLLAYCTKGWGGVPKAWLHGPDSDGAADPLPFTRDNAMGLYKRLPWFRIQMNTAMTRQRGFGKASSES